AEHAAHHAADEAAGASGIATAMVTLTAATTAASATAAAGAATRLRLFVAGARGRGGRHDLGQQCLVLQLVEIAARGVPARGLPALDHAAGRLIEHAGHLGVEAEPVEAALHVAALALVEADLVLGDLVRIRREGGRIDAGREVAGLAVLVGLA